MTNLVLTPSDNGKVKFRGSHRNTFGLSHGLPKDGGTCVGATCGTGGCLDVRADHSRQTCYVSKIIAIYKNVGKVLTGNSGLLMGKTQQEMTEILVNTFRAFKDRNKKEHWFYRGIGLGIFSQKTTPRPQLKLANNSQK